MKNFKKFKNIGLFVKKHNSNDSSAIAPIVSKVKTILEQQACNVHIDPLINLNLDLIIVIGGDGSFLSTARNIVDSLVPIVGIHKGRLGFLADLNINQIKNKLTKILNGEYIEEHRTLLQASIKKNKKLITNCALNDIVLYNGAIPRLMEFEIFIDNNFVLQLRADGLIIATPTGSTAYSLSAGGPILYPSLKIFNLVPMSPHTLSSRPLVIADNSIIKIKILNNPNNIDCGLSFDGQNYANLSIGDEINITKYKHELKLIHPKDYDYFSILREKLNWNK